MKYFSKLLFPAMLSCFVSLTHAQSGFGGNGNEGNPFFSSENENQTGHPSSGEPKIKLTLLRNNVRLSVAEADKYKNGAAHPTKYSTTLCVESNVNFRIILVPTDLTDGQGGVLDPEGFGFYITDRGKHKAGRNHLLLGEEQSPSALSLLDGEKEIITSTGFGNAGGIEKNEFEITFELGTDQVRALNGLPILMEQGIAGGVYNGAFTLRAEPID